MVGSHVEPLTAAVPERAVGPWLLTIAVALLALDLLISLLMRGLLRPATARRIAALLAVGVLGTGLLHPLPARAELDQVANPALGTRLGYIVSGDPQVDSIAKQGLEGLSEYVNARTAATLDEPDAITPGTTDLSFYPLLDWPITADASPLSSAAAAALNDYMSRGGILLIDTRDFGIRRRLCPGCRRGAATRRPWPRRAAAHATYDRPRAGAHLLSAAGLSRAIRRRHGVGAAGPGPQQRRRQPGDHRRQRLGLGLGGRCRWPLSLCGDPGRRAAARRSPIVSVSMS